MLERAIGKLLGTPLTHAFPAHTAELVRHLNALMMDAFAYTIDDVEMAMAMRLGFDNLNQLMEALQCWQVEAPTADGRKWAGDVLRFLCEFREKIRGR